MERDKAVREEEGAKTRFNFFIEMRAWRSRRTKGFSLKSNQRAAVQNFKNASTKE